MRKELIVSILYLRCQEADALYAVLLRYVSILYLRCKPTIKDILEAVQGVSILYLRCKILAGVAYLMLFDSFNSLFEMQTQALQQSLFQPAQQFQFSI